jgi:hypothetical protein
MRKGHHEHHGPDVCAKLLPALDRQNEAHWHLHQMDANYHHADPFRYSLNSFLRSIKEIPQQVQMALQHEAGFKAWFANEYAELKSDSLFQQFAKHRDFLVHQGMLVPTSYVHIGTTRDGETFKVGIPFPIDVLEDSDDAMTRFVAACGKSDLLYGLAVGHGDDSQVPCVRRVWRLASFPDEEVRTVAVRAWKRVGSLLNATLTWLGHARTSYESFPCLPSHEAPATMFRVYESRLFDGVKRGRRAL